MSLRTRLSLGYASALIVALTIFALVALAVVDGAQRAAFDEQLASTASALTIVGDVRNGRLVVDAGDRRQFATILGTKADGAIVLPGGSVAVGTDPGLAREFAGFAPGASARSVATLRVGPESFRVVVAPIVAGGRRVGAALTWRSTAVIAALDRRIALGFAVAIPLLAVLAVVAGTEIARRGLRPLERIASLASEIEARDLSRRLALPARNDELSRLGATFDRMLDRLQSAFDRERRFTSDASHELRAPLSVILAEADLALRTERTPLEYQRALETIATESDALEALTRELLAAARDGSNVEDLRGAVDLSLVASVVAQRMSVLAAGRDVCVRSVAGGDAFVDGNRALIERAVVNVVHNALKYSPQAGTVEIRVSGHGPRTDVTVRDDGPGFSPAALERAFDRFWRDDAPRSREGSGLGLSLAKTIVERYGGTIVLANADPHGAIVQMTFPTGLRAG